MIQQTGQMCPKIEKFPFVAASDTNELEGDRTRCDFRFQLTDDAADKRLCAGHWPFSSTASVRGRTTCSGCDFGPFL